MKLAIVEDDVSVREHLKALFRGDKNIEVIGVYEDGGSFLTSLKKDIPELGIIDLGLPDMSGVDVIKQIRQQAPDMLVIAYTAFDDKTIVLSAIKAGAHGYILKTASPREVIEAVHDVYSGGAPLTPKIARAIINEFQEVASDENPLTRKEQDILALLATGLSYKEIADKETVSRNTVHTHIKNIYRKLQATDRDEAVTKARRKGFI